MTIEIDISNRQQIIAVDRNVLQAAIERALQIEQIASAVLSISIVDNATIRILNRDHLQHDYATDVISFQLDFRSEADAVDDMDPSDVDQSAADEFDDESHCESSIPEPHAENELRAAGAAIEGEVIASAEMAASMAGEGRWSAENELTLYVIHGLLHVCGYDDQSPDEQSLMRSRERAILGSLGLTAFYAEDSERLRP